MFIIYSIFRSNKTKKIVCESFVIATAAWTEPKSNAFREPEPLYKILIGAGTETGTLENEEKQNRGNQSLTWTLIRGEKKISNWNPNGTFKPKSYPRSRGPYTKNVRICYHDHVRRRLFLSRRVFEHAVNGTARFIPLESDHFTVFER